MAATPTTVAIMQPYFIPYAGYFRLFAASDLFVIYDCVQFPRRGWVHRNRLTDAAGRSRWLTLPLQRAPQTVLIRDLQFPADAPQTLAARLRPFPLTAKHPLGVEPVIEAMRDVAGRPVDYLERLLKRIVDTMGLPWNVMRSSALAIPEELHGQDRILEMLKRLGARRYVNASGGRSLYDTATFQNAGIELSFLPDYAGPSSSILTRLLSERHDDLGRDIRAAGKL